MLACTNKVLIHVAFALALVLGWKVLKDQSLSSWCSFVSILAAYVMHASSQTLVKTEFHFRCFEVVCVCIHFVFTAGVMNETDFAGFYIAEKTLQIGIIFISVTLIDLKVSLTVYLCEAAVLMHKECQLVGFEHLTSTMFTLMLTWRFVVMVFLMVFIDHIMQSNIVTRMDSSDASSLMLGFRQVLRGVCDGDLLLDRSTCSIVDDASSLERLLKSSKALVNTNFLDLFLDAGSRTGFLHFLNTQAKPSADSGLRMPSGLRISLQGADGPVSVDVFQTNIPNQGATGIDYCLLALKEDPEQSNSPPDALHNTPAVHPRAVQHQSRDHTASSVSEIVEAYDELMEFALLVSNENSLFDINEVHLRFRRSTSVPALVSGMPTLKSFIRPTDWHRIETMLVNLTHLSPSQIQQRCTFRHPMLFRLPGQSRSYLCSRLTSMYLAHDVLPERPVHFWMNLSSFDASHIRRPREQELEGIGEE
eukprot:Skav235047  [mRNA]  locus=scaffold824:58306:59736:- [translate_table: standard]